MQYNLLSKHEAWHGSVTNKIDGKWDSTAQIMMQEFAKSGNSVFKCSVPSSRGVLECKKGKMIHCNAEPKCAEMLMKTILSVTQLSFYRAGKEV